MNRETERGGGGAGERERKRAKEESGSVNSEEPTNFEGFPGIEIPTRYTRPRQQPFVVPEGTARRFGHDGAARLIIIITGIRGA